MYRGVKLSIIMPLYNVEDLVLPACDSVMSQAFDGLEVVLVDDGSTDSSLAVCTARLKTKSLLSFSKRTADLVPQEMSVSERHPVNMYYFWTRMIFFFPKH